MAVVAEFISVLRKIRDVIYPEVNELYEDSLVLKESIDVGKAEFDADFAQFNTDYDTFIIKKNQVDVAVTSAQASANSASASATIATNKSNEIKAITAQSTTGAPGTSASASYNPTDGKFTFVIPQGSQGSKGDSFTVNSSGVTASRTLYDNQPTGWSFLDVTTTLLYFKQSNATANWSSGVPFGKGDTGDTGDTGVGIESFTYISTNHTSGLPAQPGGTDTYRVTLTNTLTFDYQVYNGLDADLTYVDNQIGIVQENINTISTQLANHIPLSGVTSYHLLQGNLSVSNEVITNGFGTTLYTGNGTAQSVNTGVDMDTQWGNDVSETFGGLVWLKDRVTNGYGHVLSDTIRGVNKYIQTNNNNTETTLINTITSFNNNGFSVGNQYNINLASIASWNFQTTHRRTGVTNHGKTYTEHYNPFTGFTIIKYEGSGLDGHEIPHSLGRKLWFRVHKSLTTVGNWTVLGSVLGSANYLVMNTNDAILGTYSNIDTDTSYVLSVGSDNTSGTTQIMYGWANSYFDESNKLIGNYEVGIYQGTGAIGNKVTTRGKPAWIMIKRLDAIGNWNIFDNIRNSFDGYIKANNTDVEVTADVLDSVLDGFILKNIDVYTNASGGQYLYMVVYDNDTGSGKSKYTKATDTSNIQINNALIPLAKGIDSNGSKNRIVVANETITGLTYTQGKNYLYKTDTGYGVKSIQPSYGKINPLIGDFYNIIDNKWYSNTNVEITESRNYLNHIVHADQNGQVTYVEELQKIEYKNIVKANEYKGKNACTAWVRFNGYASPLVILDSYNVIAVIRTSLGHWDVYFKEEMDNINYEVSITSKRQASFVSTGDQPEIYGKNKVTIAHFENGAYIDSQSMNIIIFGGKN